MALHGNDIRLLGVSPLGAVLETGGSFELGINQVGVFSKDSKKSSKKKGLKNAGDFSGIDPKFEKLSAIIGSPKTDFDSKNNRTIDFTLSDISKVGVIRPTQLTQEVDYFRVGWDGINDNTSLTFKKGQSLELSVTIGGVAVTFFNESCSHYTVKVPVIVPNAIRPTVCEEMGDICSPVDCRENTLKLVKDLNNHTFPGGDKFSKYFDVHPIFSKIKGVENKKKYNYWTLKYCGFGGLSEMSAVSSQYPGYDIKRDTMTGEFILLAEDSFSPQPFKSTTASLIKGCESCPDGFTQSKGGYVYAVAIPDNGEVKDVVDKPADSTIQKTGQEGALGHYVISTPKKITVADYDKMVASNKTATFFFAGSVADFCSSSVTQESAWVKKDSVITTVDTYRIVVPDACDGSVLEDLQSRYEGLKVTEIKRSNCLGLYETTVETVSSKTSGCNVAIVQDVFTSEAPSRYDLNVYWFPYSAKEADDYSVKCGFEIKSKPIILNAPEIISEDVPFIATSTRIENLSGGYPLDYSLNSFVPENQWSLTQLSRAKDMDNLGGNLRHWEKQGLFYFRETPQGANGIERELTNTQSLLDGLSQYGAVYFGVNKDNRAGINSREHVGITYTILAPIGRLQSLADYFKKLASASGVPFKEK